MRLARANRTGAWKGAPAGPSQTGLGVGAAATHNSLWRRMAGRLECGEEKITFEAPSAANVRGIFARRKGGRAGEVAIRQGHLKASKRHMPTDRRTQLVRFPSCVGEDVEECDDEEYSSHGRGPFLIIFFAMRYGKQASEGFPPLLSPSDSLSLRPLPRRLLEQHVVGGRGARGRKRERERALLKRKRAL